MNASKSLTLSRFTAIALALALSGISQAQDTTAAATAPAATSSTVAPVTPPLETGPGTVGTQGTAGGATQQVVPVPPIEAAGLADVREQLAQNTPELTLEEAVLQALQNNPTPKAARAQLAASLARIGISRAAGGPAASLGGSASNQRNINPPNNSNNAGNGGNTNNSASSTSEQLSLNISLPVYTGGRVKNSRRQAEALARAQLATAQQTEQELGAQTILGYLSVLQNTELLQVAQSNLETSRERRRVAGVRFDAGAAARLEVLRADSDLATAAQRRIAAANGLAQSKAALNILLARDPETPLRVQPIQALQLPSSVRFPLAEQATAIAAGGTAPTSPDLRAAAEATLPSLDASREAVNAAGYNVDVQRAQRKPNIAASLTGLLRNPATFVSRFAITAGLSLAQTLFSSGRISSQVAESKAQLEQARFNLQGQRLQVANAIEGSLLNLDSALKRLTSADTAVISAQEALRAAQLSYSAGAGTQLEVTDAQNALLIAQTDAVNARYQVAQAQVQLAAATAITQGGSATGSTGLGSSAGTGQSSSSSSSSANQNSGVNAGGTTQTGSSSSGGSSTGTTGGTGISGL